MNLKTSRCIGNRKDNMENAHEGNLFKSAFDRDGWQID